MILYFLDYTLLARFSKIIAAILIAMCFSTLLFGNVINGMHYFISSGLFGGFRIPIQALMLLYIPIYGGILYKYRGTGYAGLVKSLLWMIIPAWLVLYLPSVMTAGLMLVSMLVMATLRFERAGFMYRKHYHSVQSGVFSQSHRSYLFWYCIGSNVLHHTRWHVYRQCFPPAAKTICS